MYTRKYAPFPRLLNNNITSIKITMMIMTLPNKQIIKI